LGTIHPDNLLLVGRVIRPHGLEGLLRIRSYAQSERSFLNAGTIFLKLDSGEIHEFTVLSVRPHKNIFLMKLRSLNSLQEAEKYRGAEILISKDSVLEKEEDEYFWHELIGLRVYLNTGRYIGTISQILQTGSNDIYVVQEGDAEVLIPAIHDIVEEIDLSNRKMIICEMEGLLDLYEV
jgi:16S rRNA processing protein RimM